MTPRNMRRSSGFRPSSVRLGFVTILAISGAMAAMAQEVGPPRIAFEHDGRGVTGFALYAQPERGTAIRVDLGLLAADRKGLRSTSLPSLPEGTYTLSVAAYNAHGESPRVPVAPGRISLPRGQPLAGVGDPSVQGPVAASSPPAASTRERKDGILGRIWKVVVGDDSR